MKKIILCFLFLFGICPIMVNASANSLVRIGNNYYDTLEEAIANANSEDTISLISNIKLKESLDINKTVNINLNGHDISGKEKVFMVKGGVLNVTGKGTIREEEPNYGAIMVIGSDNFNDKDYSIVNVGKDVTLEGWSGIFVTHENQKSYGSVVNFSGKINALDDTSGGTGIGIYVNGNIKHENNSPIINIKDDSIINSTGNGLYIAGYAIVNIDKSIISGEESAIGIKSGVLNINDSTITCNGKDYTPTGGYNNGIKASGVAIQIESNSGYAGNMEINIKDGNVNSKNSYVIYEYIGKGSNSLVKNINIDNGKFISNTSKDVFSFSDSFDNKHSSFISGGSYSSDPSKYLETGYTATKEGDLYVVTKSVLKEVAGNNIIKYNNDEIGKILFFIPILAILIISIYTNKRKILNFIKK